MSVKQKTIKESISVAGLGLHTGQSGTMTFYPAPANHGVKFRRIDLEGQPIIDADVDNVVDTSRGTTLEQNGGRVYTIEHVLAALTGLGIDNVLIDLDMPEIPIKDGSARYFVEALNSVGNIEQDALREYIEITEPIEYTIPDKKIAIRIEPADCFQLEVNIDFETEVLGKQKAVLDKIEDFSKEISVCRTFVFLHELEFLLQNNLIRGGDLDNAIVFVNRHVEQGELDRLAKLFKKPRVNVKAEGILNNLELNFENEPARHKLLDVIGDISLLGKPLKGKIIAYRPGHQANTEFGKIIRQYLEKN
ncbi:MAG: UDP-3-O-acyl-N-acetylglucosamine deacetylase [Hyphomicrobiales bacterium]